MTTFTLFTDTSDAYAWRPSPVFANASYEETIEVVAANLDNLTFEAYGAEKIDSASRLFDLSVSSAASETEGQFTLTITGTQEQLLAAYTQKRIWLTVHVTNDLTGQRWVVAKGATDVLGAALTDAAIVIEGGLTAGEETLITDYIETELDARNLEPIVIPNDLEVIDGDTFEEVVYSADTLFLNARSTGLRFGGNITDLGAGVIRIAGGAGELLDNTDPQNLLYYPTAWAQTDIDLSAADGVYYVYANGAGNVLTQTTAPTHAEYRTRIFLHRVSIRGGVFSASTAIPQPVQQYGAQIWDIWEALGRIKEEGTLVLSAASTDLSIRISAGGLYDKGANFYNNPLDPHEVSFAEKNPVTFRHVDRAGNQGSDTTQLDVGNWDNNGTVEAITGSAQRATIFTVKMFTGSGGNVRIFYGQQVYTNIVDAYDALSNGQYTPSLPEVYNDAFTLGWIIVEKGATDLSNGTQIFVNSNKFGGVGGAISTQSILYTADSIQTDTTNFNGNLSAADTTVQAALETLDDLSAGGVDWATTQVSDQVDGASNNAFDFNTSASWSLGNLLDLQNNGSSRLELTATGNLRGYNRFYPSILTNATYNGSIFSGGGGYLSLEAGDGSQIGVGISNINGLAVDRDTGITIGRNAVSTFLHQDQFDGLTVKDWLIQAQGAQPSNTTLINGGHLTIKGGKGSVTGNGNGGNAVLSGGIAGGTGLQGLPILANLGTNEPADSRLNNNEVTFWSDGGSLGIKLKDASGTVRKTTITLT